MEFFRLIMLANSKNFRPFVNVVLIGISGWLFHLYVDSVNEKLREKDVIIEYFKLRMENTDKEYKALMETRLQETVTRNKNNKR